MPPHINLASHPLTPSTRLHRQRALLARSRAENLGATSQRRLKSNPCDFAGVAQLVEHQLAMLDVAGSNPVSRSTTKKRQSSRAGVFFWSQQKG
jgi:hypothetical protein